MKRSRIGMVTLLLVALLAGSFVTAESLLQPAPAIFSVPVGRIGDRVEYLDHARAFTDQDGNPSTNVSVWALGFSVDSTEVVADGAGVRRAAVKVVQRQQTDDTELGIIDEQRFLDLASREIVQRRGSAGTGKPWTTVGISFGPMPGLNESFRFQGESYLLGENVTERELQLVQRTFLRPTGFRQILSWSFEAKVDELAETDGIRVFAVNTSLEYSYLRLDSRGNRHWNETRNVVYWLTADVPYPVRIETRVTKSGSRGDSSDPPLDFQTVRVLQKYEAGSAPIPWLPAGEALPARDSNPDLERGPASKRFPTEGSQSRLRYPITLAKSNAESDLGLPAFQAWRATHPDAELFGYFLSGGVERRAIGFVPAMTREFDVDRWDLIYASPSSVGAQDQAYVVTTQRDARTGLVSNLDRGPGYIARSVAFSKADLPTGPITLAAVDGIWREYGNPNETRLPPSFAHWGFHWNRIDTDPTDQRVANQILAWRGNLQQIGFGRLVLSMPEAEGTDLKEAMADHRVLINATTGIVHSVTTATHIETYDLQTFASEKGIPALRPAVQPPVGPSGPRFTALVALGLSSSLLGIACIAYFYPLLKQALTQAFLPGYAKLQKAQVLENPVRDQLLTQIRAEPGVSPPELHKRVGGGWSTVVYHLSVLEKNRLVSSLIDGRHRRFFPVGELDHSARTPLAMLRNPTTRRVFETILAEPGTRQRDLANRVGITVPSLIWHLRRLEGAALIEASKAGRFLLYRARDVPPKHFSAPTMDVA